MVEGSRSSNRLGLSPEELARRRMAISHFRVSFELEGYADLPELRVLEDDWAAGDLTDEEFRDACLQNAWERAPDKSWRPVSVPGWEPKRK